MRLSTASLASKVPAALAMRGAALMPRENATVRSAGTSRMLSRGEEVFAEGDTADYFYKVVSGTIRTYKLLSDGRRQIDAFHLPGDMFGIETGAEHRFSAEAVDVATVIAFRRSRLDALSHENPGFGDEVMSSTIRSLERAQDHLLLLGRKTAQEKIATFLLDLSERLDEDERFELPMQRSDIADHLGLTIETVSRTLTQLTRDGLIKLAASSRSIVLADRAGLEKLEG
jgi:CRP/FNR family nitrogen fixation transcriptional regulator